MSRLNKLFKHTAFYAIGNIGSKAINILLLPFYTNVLTTSEYGSIDMVLITIVLLAPFVSVNMAEAVFRYSVDSNYEKDKILNTALSVSIIGIFICLLLTPFTKYFEISYHLYLSFIFLLAIFIIQNILKQYIRAEEKLKIYMSSDFIQVIAFVVFIVLLVGYYKLGIYGFIYAKALALLSDSIFLLVSGELHKSFRSGINKNYGLDMLYFGLPLVPNSLMWWISNASDRYLLASFMGLSSVGIYGVATKFPIIVSQVSAIFFKSWQTSAIEQDNAKDSSKYHSDIFNGYALVLIIVASVILVIIKPVMAMLVSDEFFDAWKYVPVLLLGSVFSALAGFLGINYTVAKDTKRALFSTIVAALVNIILNLVLIPLYSIQGACFATLISFFVLLSIRVYETPRYKKIDLKYGPLVLLLVQYVIQSFILFLVESVVIRITIQLLLLSMILIYLVRCYLTSKNVHIMS